MARHHRCHGISHKHEKNDFQSTIGSTRNILPDPVNQINTQTIEVGALPTPIAIELKVIVAVG